MQRPDNELQIRIKVCENPTFGYRRGEDGEVEKDIFDGKIPAGWVDSPAKVEVPSIVSLSRSFTTPAPVEPPVSGYEDAQPEPALSKPYENHNFKVLRAELIRRGEKWQRKDNKAMVIRHLMDLDAGNLG